MKEKKVSPMRVRKMGISMSHKHAVYCQRDSYILAVWCLFKSSTQSAVLHLTLSGSNLGSFPGPDIGTVRTSPVSAQICEKFRAPSRNHPHNLPLQRSSNAIFRSACVARSSFSSHDFFLSGEERQPIMLLSLFL